MGFYKPFRKDIQQGLVSPGAKRMSKFFPSVTTAVDAATYNLGHRETDTNGNVFEYVKVVGSVLPVAGSPLGRQASNLYVVTTDISAAIGEEAPGGMAMAAATSGQFIWMLVKGSAEGYGVTAKTDTNVADKEVLTFTTDLVWTGTSRKVAVSQEHRPAAVANGADSGSQLVSYVFELL